MSSESTKYGLVVGDRDEAQAVAISATDVSFTSGMWPTAPLTCDIAVRYRGQPARARVTTDSEALRTVTIEFPPESGPIASPGQAIVFYDGDEVLGGGTIQQVERRSIPVDLR